MTPSDFQSGPVCQHRLHADEDMVASAYAAHLTRRAADFGVILEGEVRVDMKRVKARADAVAARSRGGVERGPAAQLKGTRASRRPTGFE